MWYVMQRGFVIGAFVVMVKLVAAVLAVTVRDVAGVALHVTLNRLPVLESSVSVMSLVAVTAVVSTTTVVAAEATTTCPTGAAAHTAGEAALAQLVVVS